VHHVDVIGRDPELLGDNLCERRLVTLPLRLDVGVTRFRPKVHVTLWS
jgi:hypothetical protein